MRLESATVVVPTFRRRAALARALDGLARQTDAGIAWDVVVVDNDAGGPATSLPHLPVPARVVVEPNAGSAAARNRGISEATGAITVFLDDDVVPAPDWLRWLLEPIVAGRCDATGGRVVLDPAVARPAWLDEDGLGGYLAAFAPAGDERDLGEGEFVVTANAAFATPLLRATGGFRADLGPRPGTPLVNDDVLLTRRYVECGGRIRLVPRAVVVHELPAARLRPAYLLRRAYAQGRSDWRLDAAQLGRRRLGGARAPLHWLAVELGRRAAQRPRSVAVAFHAACDLARTAGSLREAAASTVTRDGP